MNKILLFFALVASMGAFSCSKGAPAGSHRQGEKDRTMLMITSPEFEQEGIIPSKYTCKGQNTSPPLTISGFPNGTQSVALILDDPDAPKGTFTHWVVWNLAPSVQIKFPEGHMAEGAISGVNSTGDSGYVGPCPPSGTHRYYFRAYALDQKLNLPEDADRAMLEQSMAGHVLSTGELMAKFSAE